MTPTATSGPNNTQFGILFICTGMATIVVNDAIVKAFSDRYALHQIMFIRASIGLAVGLVVLQWEGGLKALRTSYPLLHIARGLCIVVANLTFFMALATVPLADATAMFFVAPLFITLLSIPILGEKVGIRRLSAVAVGFVGVLVMLRPDGELPSGADRLTLLLPVVAALGYSIMQILTRHLRRSAPASAMSVYIQGMFLVVSVAFFLAVGDGRLAEGSESDARVFLFRAWIWPATGDWPLFLLLGLLSAITSYALTQAYRLGDAATIAPFEYVALPMAILVGWIGFGDWPDLWVLAGCVLIAGSGVYVFWREKQRAQPLASQRPIRRS